MSMRARTYLLRHLVIALGLAVSACTDREHVPADTNTTSVLDTSRNPNAGIARALVATLILEDSGRPPLHSASPHARREVRLAAPQSAWDSLIYQAVRTKLPALVSETADPSATQWLSFGPITRGGGRAILTATWRVHGSTRADSLPVVYDITYSSEKASWKAHRPLPAAYASEFCGASAPARNSNVTVGTPNRRYGYMVLSADAPNFCLIANDTLLEIPRSAVPPMIRLRGERLVGTFSTACNRYFGTGPFVVYINRRCPLGYRETDTWAMTVIPDEHSVIPNVGFSAFEGVCPEIRDTSGKPSEPC